MRFLSKIFLTGLAAVLPVAVTVYAIWWLGTTTDSLLSPVVEELLPKETAEWPLIGIALAIVFVFLVGLLLHIWVIRALFGWSERILNRIPLVKTLYGSVRDLMGFFGSSEKEGKEESQVVMVKVGDTDVRLIGLLTRDNFKDLPDGVGDEDTVAVYLPMSYQIGGFTTMVPRSAVEPVDMSTEEAMRFAVTAGMSKTRA